MRVITMPHIHGKILTFQAENTTLGILVFYDKYTEFHVQCNFVFCSHLLNMQII